MKFVANNQSLKHGNSRIWAEEEMRFVLVRCISRSNDIRTFYNDKYLE